MAIPGTRALCVTLVAAAMGSAECRAQAMPPATVPLFFSAPVPGSGPGLGQGEWDQIVAQAKEQDSQLTDLPAATRRRVLLAFVQTELAQAAGIPGFNTNQLSPAQRLDAQNIVDQIVPPPARPAPAPGPRRHQSPAPPPLPEPSPSPSPAPARPPHVASVVVANPVTPVIPVVIAVNPAPATILVPVASPVVLIPVAGPSHGKRHHFFCR